MKQTHRKVHHWPTHWAGGNNSVKIGEQNVPWVEFDDGGELCRIHPSGKVATDETVQTAFCVAEAWNATWGANINPKGIQGARDALKEIMNHCYTTQDADRYRELARAALSALAIEPPKEDAKL